jgi:acetylornithine deacetylase
LEHLEALATWVERPSLSGDEGAFAAFVEGVLRADGFRVERQKVAPGRFNVLASRRPSPEVVFCSHLDTVPPHIPPRIEGRTLYGRGSCDAKGALYAMRQAVLALEDAGIGGAGLAFVVGEETDHAGAKAARAAGWRCRHLVIGEPTRNRFLPAQKGTLKVRYRARGKAGHSAFPDRGRSAVHALVRDVAAVLESPLPSDPRLGPTTVNFGRIGGGVADNVFAPEAETTAFFRTTVPARELWADVKAGSRDVKRQKLAATDPLEFAVPPWGRVGEVAAFNTDAPYLKGCYRSVYLVGPGDIREAHGDRERITARGLAEATRIYRRLGEELLS